MTILNIAYLDVGQVGVKPSICFIYTNNTLAQVTATGFLNDAVAQGAQFSDSMMALVTTKTSPSASAVQVGWLEIQKSGSNWSLAAPNAPGVVTLPTIANHIAVYNNTTGGLGEDAATAINAGNLQAGLSGTAGTLISFPATAANGSFIFAAANAGGAFNTTISNGAMAQSTVYTLGDIGAASGGIPVSTGAIRMKMVADAAAGGGSATQNIVDAFCTAASVVLAFWQTQANNAVIRRVVPGVGSFDIISDVDAGAGTVNYVILK